MAQMKRQKLGGGLWNNTLKLKQTYVWGYRGTKLGVGWVAPGDADVSAIWIPEAAVPDTSALRTVRHEALSDPALTAEFKYHAKSLTSAEFQSEISCRKRPAE